MQRGSGWRATAGAIAGWAHPALSAVGRSGGGGARALDAAGAPGMSPFPHLSVLTLLPFAGGIAILLLSRAGRSAARLTALTFATAAVAYTVMLWCRV